MAKITVRLRVDRLDKNGKTTPLLVLYNRGRTRELSLGVKVDPNLWDKSKFRVASKKNIDIVSNSIISKKIDRIQSIIDKAQLNQEIISLDEIIERYKRLEVTSKTVSLSDYLSLYIDENPDNLAQNTLLIYNSLLKRIKEFFGTAAIIAISISDIKKFNKYLINDCENNENTTSTRLKVLRKIFKRALEEKLIEQSPMDGFKIKGGTSSKEFLLIEELKSFSNLDNLPNTYELVKDMFIFSCYAGGIRFGDLCLLQKSNFTKSLDGKTIILKYKMSKTKAEVDFILPDKARELYEKYYLQKPHSIFAFPILNERLKPSDKFIFKQISNRNAYFNKVLKLLIEKAEINKHISWHCSRHTHAVISLIMETPLEVVSSILGHKSLSQTQVYAKIVKQVKSSAMQKWNEI